MKKSNSSNPFSIAKPYQRLSNPRWRSILVQGTVDHLATIVLTKTATMACIENFQCADKKDMAKCAELVAIGSGVGFASHDEGVADLCSLFKAMACRSETGKLATSDVSGMDWSLGGSVLLATYKFMHDARPGVAQGPPLRTVETPDMFEDQHAFSYWCQCMRALGYVAHNPAYVVGTRVLTQACHGVCQTGDAITTWQDNVVRVWDAIMRNGVKTDAGTPFVLKKDFKSGLELRDATVVDVALGNEPSWCG